MFRKISFENLTGFQNLSGLVCEIIYLKSYSSILNLLAKVLIKKIE